jgi:hypothetical protein
LNGGLLGGYFGQNADATFLPNLLCKLLQMRNSVQADLIPGVANVQGRDNTTGYYVDCSRQHVNVAYSRDQWNVGRRIPFYLSDPLRCGSQRILAKLHGRGARVIRMAFKCEAEARLTHDAFDNGQRFAGRVKHGPLFDMNLEGSETVSRKNCSVSELFRFESEVPQSVSDGDPFCID